MKKVIIWLGKKALMIIQNQHREFHETVLNQFSESEFIILGNSIHAMKM